MPTTMSPSGAATENRSDAALTATAIASSVTSVSATSTLLFKQGEPQTPAAFMSRRSSGGRENVRLSSAVRTASASGWPCSAR